MENLDKYNQKRDFKKTKEPLGKKAKSHSKVFCVQHHLARKDHYDFRFEMNGILLSFAVPKGPSYNTSDKRLAIQVENHPLPYRNFEGVIPKGEYGGGVVLLWDRGKYEEVEPFNNTYKKGYLKFILKGTRLKGKWSLTKFKDNNWLLIKDSDGIKMYDDINEYQTSVKTGRTMEEIEGRVVLTSPKKILYTKTKTTKESVFTYYKKVSTYMLPYVRKRLLSTVRAPNGTDNTFFKKHFPENENLVPYKKGKDTFYYIENEKGILSEVQMNSIEFHIGGSRVDDYNHPHLLVFDLDPDEKLSLKKVRDGVRKLKSILDELKLKSYLKTSGGKGYHIVVLLNNQVTWKKFETLAKSISNILVSKYPEDFTTNIRKDNRQGKIFIDYMRNKKGATSVAPYSLRARGLPTVSMPIKWSELDKVKPDDITIEKALKRLKRKDPWESLRNSLQ